MLLVYFPDAVRADEAGATFVLAGAGSGMALLCAVGAVRYSPDDDDEDSGEKFARLGPYAGVALAYAVNTFESDVEGRLVPKSDNLSVKNSFGLKGRVGYRCHRYASAEVQVEWLDGFDGTVFRDGAGKVKTGDIEPIVVTVNARGYVPLWNDRVQPFGLLGAGLVNFRTVERDKADDSHKRERDTAPALRAGGGIDVYATPNVVVTFEADYLHGLGSANDLHYVSIGVGLQYRY
jgi:outer membrane protein W